MSEMNLHVVEHPKRDAEARFEALVGIDHHKQNLLDELALLVQGADVEAWQKKHHPTQRQLLMVLQAAPLVILSGDVGCGKTALATSVGSPLARRLDRKVVSLETPSDIRGGGRVGELSQRVTEAFTAARSRARESGCVLLVIDEADDLVTSRSQTQAHHEDRAGVNVVVKQIDQIARDKVPMAVVMITNRYDAVDPAVARRAALHLRFSRPDELQRGAIFERLLTGVPHSEDDVAALVRASAPRAGVPFSYSDLAVRLARTAVRRAFFADRSLTCDDLRQGITMFDPAPLFDEGSRG